MALRGDLERRIEKKQQEIADLASKLGEARSYLQALEDTLKLLPREGVNQGRAAKVLRRGSNVALARKALLHASKPLHIDELLRAIGLPDDRKHRLALSGSLASYVRKGEIFSRPAPNTFGLLELNGSLAAGPASIAEPEPPIGFGGGSTPANADSGDEKDW